MLTRLFLRMLNYEASLPKKRAQTIIEKLNLSEGDVVADIGSGGGYFSLAFAQRIGDRGKVFAVDNNPKHLEFVRQQAEMAGLRNIEMIALESHEVPLPEASLDLIFARSVFHHLDDPEGFFRCIRNTLKPEGKVAIIDYLPGGGFSFVRICKHFTPVEKIRQVMVSAGYRLVDSFDFLDGQSFTVWSSLPSVLPAT